MLPLALFRLRSFSLVFSVCLSLCTLAWAQRPQSLPVPNACVQSGGPPPCRDTDGDGLCDSWEHAGRIPGGALLPDADPNRPDIYVHYDYMGWGTPGNACTQDSDCTQGGATPNYVCHEGRCNHNHKPAAEVLQIVVDSFARHGVALHIDPDPREVPHSDVITFSTPGDGTPGATAACAGADIQPGVLGGSAVSLFDIKDRYFDPAKQQAYHYTVFSHFATCLQDGDQYAPGFCGACPLDRATPQGLPNSSILGTSELPGNDFIVALGPREFTANIQREIVTEAATFMHELGHNLGLHHDGDNADHDEAPNYLSVMNNRYLTHGISEAQAAGSAVPKTCSSNAECQPGNICYHFAALPPSVPARCRRVDYSSSTLNTISESALDESAGVSPLSSGLRDIIEYWNFAGGNGFGPAAGPVNWDGLPAVTCTLDGDCAGGGSLTGKCLAGGACQVRADLNKNGVFETFKGYNDWDHGACKTSADCPVNGIRLSIHESTDPSVDPHEPCVQNRCQTLWYAFQCTAWGKKD